MRRFRRTALGLITALSATLLAPPTLSADALFLGTTTSVDNSGLLAPLLDRFTADTGIAVRSVVQSSGAILRLARSGDLDVVLTHDPDAEADFIAAGHGTSRLDVMTSRFLVVGPGDDPAAIAGMSNPAAALQRIAAAGATFISRGDRSGTHTAERKLWQAANLDPQTATDKWYRESGSGMGQTLNVAGQFGAYTLTESGSWANFGNKGTITVHVDNQAAMANPYSVILVNPERHRHINADAARRLIDWLTGPIGQKEIDGFTIDGQQPFKSAQQAD